MHLYRWRYWDLLPIFLSPGGDLLTVQKFTSTSAVFFRYPNNETLMQYLLLPNISEGEISATNYIFTLGVFCNSASLPPPSPSPLTLSVCKLVDRRRFKDVSIACVRSKWSLYKVNRIVLEQNFILLMSAKWLLLVTQNNEFPFSLPHFFLYDYIVPNQVLCNFTPTTI